MEKESDLRKRPYHRRPLQCRLCLREYGKPLLGDIFAKGSQLNDTIFAAVSVKTIRNDHVTRICIHCQDIVQLINNFRAACHQSEMLLAQGSYVLKSDTWDCADNISIFERATNLVQMHLREIEVIANRVDRDVRTVDTKQDLKAESESQEENLAENIIFDGFVDETSDFLTGIEKEQQRFEKDTVLELTLATKHSTESIDFDGNVEIQEVAHFSDDDTKDDTPDHCKKPNKAKRGRKKSANKREHSEKVICSVCGELVSQQGLEGHLNRHLGVAPFACDIEGCEAKLHSKFALQQHRSRHKTANRYYDCEVCGKRIKGTPYWLIHRKIHTDEPRFQCDICGKKFRRKCKLKVHSTVHSGLANFPCEICGKYFTVKHNLTAHYKLHMKNGTYPKNANFTAKPQEAQQMQE